MSVRLVFGTLHLHHHPRPSKSSLSFGALPPQHASSQRISNFSLSQGGSVHHPRTWTRPISSYDQEDDDQSDEDRSLDLLLRFIQNVFNRVSKKARKAVRSVLPVTISTQL